MARYSPPPRDEHDTCPDCRVYSGGNRLLCSRCEAEIQAVKEAVLRILDGNRPDR